MNFATRMHDVLAALPLAAVAWTPKAVCLELVRALPAPAETLPMVKGARTVARVRDMHITLTKRWRGATVVAFKAGVLEARAGAAPVPLLVALGQVALVVTPPWPLALVMQAEQRRQYARVFHLLLRLKLASLVAQSGTTRRWGGARERRLMRLSRAVRHTSASVKRHAMPIVVAVFHFRVQRFLRALQVRRCRGRTP
jgi:hypothetical protein